MCGTRAGACQQKASRATLPLTALLWLPLGSGEHVVGQWCSWIMMKNWAALHGMCGSMEAELEVQRTIKRAELTALSCLLVVGPMKVHVGNKGRIDGLWREEQEIASIRELETLICGLRLGKNCTFLPHEILWWQFCMSRHTTQSLSLKAEKANELAKNRSNVGRRIYGGSESKDSPTRWRGSSRGLAVRGQLSLLGG